MYIFTIHVRHIQISDNIYSVIYSHFLISPSPLTVICCLLRRLVIKNVLMEISGIFREPFKDFLESRGQNVGKYNNSNNRNGMVVHNSL